MSRRWRRFVPPILADGADPLDGRGVAHLETRSRRCHLRRRLSREIIKPFAEWLLSRPSRTYSTTINAIFGFSNIYVTMRSRDNSRATPGALSYCLADPA
jgi:hypothetical protein